MWLKYIKSIAKKIFMNLTNHGFTHDLELALILKEKKKKFESGEVVHKKGSKINFFRADENAYKYISFKV